MVFSMFSIIYYFPMIVTIGNTKGGVGKTTLALNLSVAQARAGRDVLLVDGDRQASALTAIAARDQGEHRPAIACAHYPDGRILRSQVQIQSAKYDDVLIDAGGRDSTALRAALTLCDALLVPIVPRSLDVWALDDMVALIEETAALRGAFPALAVLNLADPRGKDNDEAAELVAGISALTYLPTPVRRRKAIASATGQGLAAAEFRPADLQAISEMEALANAVFSIIST